MINCVIIDDEPLAREGLASYVREVEFLQLVATCVNPVELIKLLDLHHIDLIFLDIQMPKMNGIEFLKIMPKTPMVIITTAFPSYALESFQLNVLDYLLKPVTFDRFFKAVNKAKDYHQLITKSAGIPDAGADYFFIKCGSKFEKIYFHDILYIQGTQNYVTIYTHKGKYMTLLYLRNLEENLDSKLFIRIHKSFIVSINKIETIEGNEVVIPNHRIPVSRNYRDQLIQQVVMNKLIINR